MGAAPNPRNVRQRASSSPGATPDAAIAVITARSSDSLSNFDIDDRPRRAISKGCISIKSVRFQIDCQGKLHTK